MFKNKSFRKAILTFQNVRHCAFCKAKKMTWHGMIIKWLQLKQFFELLPERKIVVLFLYSTPDDCKRSINEKKNQNNFQISHGNWRLYTILCSLIMSLSCIIEENRKENNVNTEMLPAMWCALICNSKNSSNLCKPFHKDFLERVSNKAKPAQLRMLAQFREH